MMTWIRDYECLADPLDAHVKQLVAVLERIALEGCEHIYGGDCWVEGEHSLDSDELETRVCNSCAARAVLRGEGAVV